jgi:hypothetical protein
LKGKIKFIVLSLTPVSKQGIKITSIACTRQQYQEAAQGETLVILLRICRAKVAYAQTPFAYSLDQL